MKTGAPARTSGKHCDFPLFSQKCAGESRLQVKTVKWFGTVSTDSQESSQQQSFILLFQNRPLVEEGVVVDFSGEDQNLKKIRCCDRPSRSTFPQCCDRVGLYTFRKSE